MSDSFLTEHVGFYSIPSQPVQPNVIYYFINIINLITIY